MYVVKASGPSPLPHSPEAGGRGWLPKLFDHTLSSDISQYNHFPISSAQNFAIITMHDHGELFRLIYGATEVTYQAALESCCRVRPDPVYQLAALRKET
ncbi:MAG: hypothetical protein WBF34_12665 [Streptosporangiaceae bacterium]